MGSKYEIVNFKSGVTLKKVTIFNGGVPVSQAYTVGSNRTPEVKSFDGRAEADAYFSVEVSRCS